MDPSNLIMRKACIISSMMALREMARVFPMVALNESMTRLAVGDAIGEIHDATIRVYDIERYIGFQVTKTYFSLCIFSSLNVPLFYKMITSLPHPVGLQKKIQMISLLLICRHTSHLNIRLPFDLLTLQERTNFARSPLFSFS